MKFWQKVYLLILLLFIVAFDIGGYALINKSYQINEQGNTSAGIMSYNAAKRDFVLNYGEYRKYTTGDITAFIDSFVKNYALMMFFLKSIKGKNCYTATSLLFKTSVVNC